MRDLFEEIFMALRMNKLRTALTGFSIAWGIFMLVVLLACGNGVKHAMELNFEGMSKNVVRLWPGWRSMPYKGMKKNQGVFFDNDDVAFFKEAIPHVNAVSPMGRDLWNITVGYGTRQYSVGVRSVEPIAEEVFDVNMVSGRFINEIDLKERRKVVVLQDGTVSKIFPAGVNPVGLYVNINKDSLSIPFKVIGVYNVMGSDRYQMLYMPLSTQQIIYNANAINGQIGAIDLMTDDSVNDKESAAAFEIEVRNILSRRFIYDPNDKSAVWIYNRIDQFMQNMMIMNGLTMFVWIIGFGMLIAGIVGVSNIMLITVKERTREIGIRKALGATPNNILLTILLEALCITSIFGYIGMLLGIGVSEILSQMFPASRFTPENPTMFIDPSVDVMTVLMATLVLVFAGLLAGFFPARKAVYIKPIEAMSAK